MPDTPVEAPRQGDRVLDMLGDEDGGPRNLGQELGEEELDTDKMFECPAAGGEAGSSGCSKIFCEGCEEEMIEEGVDYDSTGEFVWCKYCDERVEDLEDLVT